MLEAEQADVPRPGLHLQIGEAYLQLKRWEDAERSFRKAGGLDPVNAHVQMGLCRCYLNQRQNRRTAEAALETIGLRYHYPMAHYCLGVALHRMRRSERAIQALELAISQNPNFAEAHERLAAIHLRWSRDLEKAKEHQRLAGEIHEQNRQRRRKSRKASIPELAPVDIDATLPKVPEAEPDRPSDRGHRPRSTTCRASARPAHR